MQSLLSKLMTRIAPAATNVIPSCAGPRLWVMKLKALLKKCLNVFLPHQCPCCLKITEGRGVCSACWSHLHFLGPPHCIQCGYPFAFHISPSTLCGGCLREAPPFTKAFSVLAYNDTSKQLVFSLKRGRKLMLVPLFSQWLFYQGQHLFPGVDFILPVPLHWRRLWQRRFNQSGVLAKALSKKAGIPFLPNFLKRIRATPTQGRMSRQQRFENVQGAFHVLEKHRPFLKDTCVLLVDDVYTTGATLHTCAHALLKAGVKEVRVLTLTRTVREHSKS